jgi:hypothetical protein
MLGASPFPNLGCCNTLGVPWQTRQLLHNAKGAVNSGPPQFHNLYSGLFDLGVEETVTIRDVWATVHLPPTSATLSVLRLNGFRLWFPDLMLPPFYVQLLGGSNNLSAWDLEARNRTVTRTNYILIQNAKRAVSVVLQFHCRLMPRRAAKNQGS